MPTLSNLTQHQVALLDDRWACDTLQEFEEFLETLDSEDRAEADRLQRLLLVEMLDEEMQGQNEFPEARRVIQQIVDNLPK